MLTRFVRIQLLIFTIVGIVGVIAMVLFYIQAPTLLGIGRMTVTLELPSTGGLYRFSNVTYRGVQIGKVTAVSLTPNGAKATLSLSTSPKIPANLQAEVLSVSAVGEQYVDLRPRTDSGAVSARRLGDRHARHHDSASGRTDARSGERLGRRAFPKNKIGQLLDESFQAFNGAGYDLGSLTESASRISADSNSIVDRTRALTEDSRAAAGTRRRRRPTRSGRGRTAWPGFPMCWRTTIPRSARSCRTVPGRWTRRRGSSSRSSRRCRCCLPT